MKFKVDLVLKLNRKQTAGNGKIEIRERERERERESYLALTYSPEAQHYAAEELAQPTTAASHPPPLARRQRRSGARPRTSAPHRQ